MELPSLGGVPVTLTAEFSQKALDIFHLSRLDVLCWIINTDLLMDTFNVFELLGFNAYVDFSDFLVLFAVL